jgi:GNAT superfamily N-acetyltransferase
LMPCENLVIRPISPADHAAVREIAQRSFSVTQSGYVRPGPDDLVATIDGRVAAAVLLQVLDLPNAGRVGRIAWLLTGPEYRGLGIARQLVRRGVEQLRALGCGSIATEVEGYNTPSANIFHEHEFRRLGTAAQIRWIGAAGALLLGIRTSRLFTPGHFLWALGVPGQPACTGVQRAGAWALNVLIALLALLMGGGLLLAGDPQLPGIPAMVAVVVAVALVLGLREAAMKMVARGLGQPLEFRGWGSGVGASVLIATLFGSVFPVPGGCYPPGDGWRHHQFRRTLALSAAGGTSAVALLLLVALSVRAWIPGGFAAEVAKSVANVGIALLAFDSIVAFAPFQGYNAARMLDYSKPLWIGFALTGLFILILAVTMD